MPPTREEVVASMQRLEQQVSRHRAVDLSLLHSAAVKAEALTGHPGWDSYLQQLQGRLEQAMNERTSWDERMKRAYSETDTRLAQVNWHIWNARIDALNEVMQLPSKVLETYHHEHALATRSDG